MIAAARRLLSRFKRPPADHVSAMVLPCLKVNDKGVLALSTVKVVVRASLHVDRSPTGGLDCYLNLDSACAELGTKLHGEMHWTNRDDYLPLTGFAFVLDTTAGAQIRYDGDAPTPLVATNTIRVAARGHVLLYPESFRVPMIDEPTLWGTLRMAEDLISMTPERIGWGNCKTKL